MRVATQITLTEQERSQLEVLAASVDSAPRVAQRARIILMAARGDQNKTIAPQLGIGRAQVARWRERYVESGLGGILKDLPRGAPPIKVDMARLVALTNAEGDAPARAWSTRRLAAELGVSAASVSRHRRAAGIAVGDPVKQPLPTSVLRVMGAHDNAHAVAPAQPLLPQAPAARLEDAVLSSAAHAVSPIASTKVLPPRETRQLMPRDVLMSRLLEARRQRCVVIQGQAGSGKTSTLMAWRKSMISLGYDVCWLSLSAEDNESARFFDCLLASIAETDAASVREASLVVGGNYDEAAIELWVITLVQALGRRRRELVLMIDDLHHVTDPNILQALQWLLDYAPPQLHLAFSSRSAIVLSMERLRMQGTLSEFDMRDLRFNQEESERFLREQLGTIDRDSATSLHALTDGWVAGLQLFAIALRTRQGGKFPLMQVRDARAFASYFEREVLTRLAPQELEMLMRVAICQRFCAPLCADVLGEPQSVAKIKSRLCRLVADNLFISVIGSHDNETWYRIHPLLRETLLSRLAEYGEARLRSLHAAAWRWFDARNQIDDAVFHAVKAGDTAAAAGMVERCAQPLLVRGELNQLAGLMRLLPAEQVRERFGLHVVMAYLQLYGRDFDALRASLDQMEASHALDAKHRYTLLLLRAGLELQLDNTDAAATMLPQLQDVPADVDDFTWQCRGNVVSWLLTSRSEYDQVRSVLEEADVRPGAPRSLQLGRCIHAISLAREGGIELAGKIVREVMEEAERHGKAYVGLACMAAGLLADTLYELNETEGACQLLEPRIGVLERVSLPEVVLRACVVLSNAHWLAGRHAQALSYLDRLEAYAVRYGLDRLLAEALVLRLRRHLQLGEMERASVVLECVRTIASRNVGAGLQKAARTAAAAARAHIEMALHTKDYATAIEYGQPMLSEMEQGGELLGAPGLRLQLAFARQKMGEAQAARYDVIEAMRQGHRLGLMRSLLDAVSTPASLAILARDGMPDPVLAFYVDRVKTAAQSAGPAPCAISSEMPAGPIGLLSEREREILGLLAQAMSNKKIAKVLNVSAETVKWHLKNIYGKLGVAGRGGAAARLRDCAI